MRKKSEIQRERAELVAVMRPEDSLWECPKCRAQVLIEGSKEFWATCDTCATPFVRVQAHEAPAPCPGCH